LKYNNSVNYQQPSMATCFSLF